MDKPPPSAARTPIERGIGDEFELRFYSRPEAGPQMESVYACQHTAYGHAEPVPTGDHGLISQLIHPPLPEVYHRDAELCDTLCMIW